MQLAAGWAWASGDEHELLAGFFGFVGMRGLALGGLLAPRAGSRVCGHLGFVDFSAAALSGGRGPSTALGCWSPGSGLSSFTAREHLRVLGCKAAAGAGLLGHRAASGSAEPGLQGWLPPSARQVLMHRGLLRVCARSFAAALSDGRGLPRRWGSS
mmetsp:Transcript_25432/g.78275  ORF Transcript_25432/g.78275 Transcript_25432/m.78275 type:complete len:156 (+) Transcript_25432:144-611(+)